MVGIRSDDGNDIEVKLVSFHRAELQADGRFCMMDRRQCRVIKSVFAPDTTYNESSFVQRVRRPSSE